MLQEGIIAKFLSLYADTLMLSIFYICAIKLWKNLPANDVCARNVYSCTNQLDIFNVFIHCKEMAFI